MLFSLRRGKKHETFIKLGAPGTKLQVKDSNPFPFLIIYDLCRQYLQSQELIGLRKLALHERIKSPSCAKPCPGPFVQARAITSLFWIWRSVTDWDGRVWGTWAPRGHCLTHLAGVHETERAGASGSRAGSQEGTATTSHQRQGGAQGGGCSYGGWLGQGGVHAGSAARAQSH